MAKKFVTICEKKEEDVKLKLFGLHEHTMEASYRDFCIYAHVSNMSMCGRLIST